MDAVRRGERASIGVRVLDAAGMPVNGILPVEVRIQDPAGSLAEFSGFYGARDGAFSITVDIAPNDTPGIWTVEARDLAAGLKARRYMRLLQ